MKRNSPTHGYGYTSQARSRCELINRGEQERDMVRCKGLAYNFENVGDDSFGRDMTVVLEQISLSFIYAFEGWFIPSHGLVS